MSAPGPDREPHRMPDLVGDVIRFLDGMGIPWSVSEHDGARVPGSRGPRYLRFASDYAVRRVWVYPHGWRTLPTSALEAVGWGR